MGAATGGSPHWASQGNPRILPLGASALVAQSPAGWKTPSHLPDLTHAGPESAALAHLGEGLGETWGGFSGPSAQQELMWGLPLAPRASPHSSTLHLVFHQPAGMGPAALRTATRPSRILGPVPQPNNRSPAARAPGSQV